MIFSRCVVRTKASFNFNSLEYITRLELKEFSLLLMNASLKSMFPKQEEYFKIFNK